MFVSWEFVDPNQRTSYFPILTDCSVKMILWKVPNSNNGKLDSAATHPSVMKPNATYVSKWVAKPVVFQTVSLGE